MRGHDALGSGAHTTLLSESLFLLGQAYYGQDDVPKAFRALVLASRLSDRLHRRARTPRLSRYWTYCEVPLYELLVQVAWRYYQLLRKANKHTTRLGIAVYNSGLTFAEKGRTLFLQSELANHGFLPRGANREALNDFFALRRRWHQAELRLLEKESSAEVDRPEERLKVLDILRVRRNSSENQYLAALEVVRERFGDPAYDPDQPFLPLHCREILALASGLSVDQTTALIEFYFAGGYLMTFVIFPNTWRWARTPVPRDLLDDLARRWQRGLGVLKRSPAHWEKGYLTYVLQGLRKLVWYPAQTITEWEREYGQVVERVIIIPHRFLQLIPLHAVTLPDGSLWGDHVKIQYAPSASVLGQLIRPRHSSKAGPDHKAVVVSYAPPDEPLLFHADEARAVAQELDAVMLTGEHATKANVITAIKDAGYIHVSSHGSFDPKAPLDASLKLASDRGNSACNTLTLGEIFERVQLPNARLVVLSACETGLSKVEPFHEEYVGLPAGFLHAGAPTVISSLWAVSDLATWLVMGMLSHHLAAGEAPAAALANAQEGFRALTKADVLARVRAAASAQGDPGVGERMVQEGERLVQSTENPCPFASPYWWAGFTVNGLG